VEKNKASAVRVFISAQIRRKEFGHRHPIEEKNAPQGEMDGMFETCHLAGYEKTKTPPSIGFKVQRFPAALQSDSLPPGVQIGEGNWR
jgi:hypothetical protein